MILQNINLLVSINKSYLPMCETMLFSFFKHHQNNNVKVYVLNNKLEERELEELKKHIVWLGGEAIVLPVPDDLFRDMPTVANRFSTEIYYRIFAHRFLPGDVDRVLWLDADIVLRSNIEELYNQDFEDKSLVVCKDFGCHSKDVAVIKNKMDIAQEHYYFNSGIILFNLKLIRDQFDEEAFNKTMLKYANELRYPDQDLLNHIYQGKVKYIDEVKYNYQVNCIYKVNADEVGIKVLHYAGNKKPWDVKYARPICKYYWQYQFEMKKYKEFFLFYLQYYILWIPKYIKRLKYPEY